MKPRILNLQEVKSIFNSNIYWTLLWVPPAMEHVRKIWKNHYPMDSSIHLSYNQSLTYNFNS